jgi:CTP:molybdopterin cytidylyltransferase MocA
MARLSFTGIVLAAGNSTRLGRPKQNVQLPTGDTLLEHTCHSLIDAGVDKIAISLQNQQVEVFASNEFLLQRTLRGVELKVLKLASPTQNMSESFFKCLTNILFESQESRLSALNPNSKEYFIVCLCDTPGISAAYLQSFFEFAELQGKEAVYFTERIENLIAILHPPVIFSKNFALELWQTMKKSFLNNDDGEGALSENIKPYVEKTLRKLNIPMLSHTFPAQENWYDIDTPADLENLKLNSWKL